MILHKIKKKIDGAISLMLVAILIPTMLLSGLMVDLSRYSMAKSMISSAGDLTLNAALADYDGILQDVYGLFAVAQDDEDLYDNLANYFEKTLVSNGVVSATDAEDYVGAMLDNLSKYMAFGDTGELQITNLFNMEIKTENSVQGVAESTLDHPEVLKKQIVEYMKYRAPINFAAGFFSGLMSLGKSEQQANVVEAKVDAEQYVQKVGDEAKNLYDWIKKYDNELISSKIYSKDFSDTRAQDTLPTDKLALNDTADLGPESTSELIGKLDKESNPVPVSTVYNVQLLNQYVLGVLLDAKQADVVAKYPATLSSECYSTITGTDTPEQAIEKLRLQVQACQERQNALGDDAEIFGDNLNNTFNVITRTYNEYKDLYGEFYNDTTKAEVRENIKGKVRTEFSTILTPYKTLLGFLQESNKTNSNAEHMITRYNLLVKERYILEKTYASVLTRYEDAKQEKTDKQTEFDTVYARIVELEGADGSEDASTLIGKAEIAYTSETNATKKAEKLQAWTDLKDERDTANTTLGELDDRIKELEPIIEDYRKALEELYNYVPPLPQHAPEKSEYDTVSKHFTASVPEQRAAEAMDKLSRLHGYYTMIVEECEDYAKKLYNGIYAESTYLTKKVDNLVTYSEKIYNVSGQLITKIKNYNTKLDTWETANNKASSENGGDGQFGDSNKEEIAANRNAYSEEEVQKVKSFAYEQYSTMLVFQSYLNGDGYRYGGTSIDELTSYNALITAARSKAGTTFADKVEITFDQIEAYFPTMVKEEKVGYEYTDSTAVKSFTHDKDNTLPFVGYLVSTYPASKSDVKADEKNLSVENADGTKSEEDAESSYNNMVESLKGNQSEGTESGNKYGYTYESAGSISKGTSGGGDGIDTSVGTDGEGDIDSKSTVSDNKASAGILSGIADALKTGRNNLYIMEYAFSNFSYNTVVQDAAYDATPKDKRKSFYADTMFLSAGSDKFKEIYGNYMALTAAEKAEILSDDNKTDLHEATRPQTLSGYPIAEYNNKIYGAEVEYMLYGFSNPKNNVIAADASIFGIRFIMNCIFAFTNSEIRNITRTAGLAVQAATLGFVPYQVVMIVLQLALSLSESLLDIKIMHTGAKVAIVKTKDTWILSPTGAGNLLKDVAAAKAKEVVTEAVTAAADYISTGIQEFVDSSLDKLEENASKLADSVEKTVTGKANEIVDDVLAQVEEALMGGLNQLRYIGIDPGQDPATIINGKIDEAFSQAESALTTAIDKAKEGIPGGSTNVGETIADTVTGQVTSLLGELKTTAKTQVSTIIAEKGVDVAPETYITNIINNVQSKISTGITEKVGEITEFAKNKAKSLSNTVKTEITTMAKEKTESAKDAIIEKTNGFIDKSVNTITDKMPSMEGLGNDFGSVDGSGSASKAISFGYSDYLRAFFFLGICANDGKILTRMAQLIEENINYPNEKAKGEGGEGDGFFKELFSKISWFFTKKESKKKEEETTDDKWYINKAYTYVKIDADVDMKMFFLNSDFFKSAINTAYNETGGGSVDLDNTVSTFHYHSVMGY